MRDRPEANVTSAGRSRFWSSCASRLIPLTPGGIGFVEAGLVGTLTLAGVSGGDALAATLLYRLGAFWLPLPAGAIAYLLFRRHYGSPTR
jgi:uncharacterized protein (TIRG00374 family)